jgi:D-arabinose 1-dehydrogenase-like Zn-dependent alcohol dehydrogenase
MQAIVLKAFGSPENFHLATLPDPRPGPGEVLIKVHECGVCYHDVINRRGELPRTKTPAILGHEIAGEVVEVGAAVEGWRIGDRAATLQRLSCGKCTHCQRDRATLCKHDTRFFGEELDGGYATLMRAPVQGLVRVPAELDWAVAATTCCTTGTAVHSLRTRGRMKKGETVLITGASGGVGLQAVQLARHDGARVIAITSSEEKRKPLQQAGADEVIVSPDLQFSSAVRRVTDGAGVDVAMEIVGARAIGQTMKCMAPGGRLVVVGNVQTESFEANPGLLIVKELELMGAYATTRAELDVSMSLIASGAVKPWISEVVPLADAPRVHTLLEQRRVAGRMVLAPHR